MASILKIVLLLAVVVCASAAPLTGAPMSACPAPGSGKCGLLPKVGGGYLQCKVCVPAASWAKSTPAQTCNWGTGMCQANANHLGAICAGPSAKCSPLQFCTKVVGKPGYRCCRKVCPPGLCGVPGMKYTTFCGTVLTCPAKC